MSSRSIRTCLLLVVIGPAVVQAAPPAGPGGGILWEETIEMSMPAGSGFQMPAQTRKVCRPADPEQWTAPSGARDEDCRVTDVKRTPSRMTWKVVCEKSRTTGEGDMAWSGRESYTATMNLHSAEHGDLTSRMRGRKVGDPCDPGEEQRAREQTTQRIAAMQAQQAQGIASLCESAVENLDFNILTNYDQCKARQPDACARLQTFEGYERMAPQHESVRTRAETTCRVKMAEIRQALCNKTTKALRKDAPPNDPENRKHFTFLAASCPPEKLALVQDECAGKAPTGKNQPAEWVRGFCVAYAQDVLRAQPVKATASEPKPAAKEKPSADDPVEAAKKAAKGIFGF